MASSGLSTSAARAYVGHQGYNEIIEKKDSVLEKVAKQSFSFISGMLLFAAILSFASGKLFEGSFILVLLALNIAITVWQEHKADDAIEKLNAHLATLVKVMRDGAWQMLASRLLAAGDLIELKAGSIVPADARVISATAVRANEAALTGESLPKEKKSGDLLYSGSFITSGLSTAEVIATGSNTSFGKTLTKVNVEHKKSSLEKDILRISRFLSILSIGAVVLLTGALLFSRTSFVEIARLDLSLIIAGIPISLPTVMTLIIAFGVMALAKKDIVVRRLSSLEELANTDLLLTDKTGTLTENKIAVNEIICYGDSSQEEVAKAAAVVAAQEPDNSINQGILGKVGTMPEAAIAGFIPGDSTRKRSTVTVRRGEIEETLSLGAPQVIAGLCALPRDERQRFENDVERLGQRGYRTLALARTEGAQEINMKLLGLLSLSDTLRPDARSTLEFLAENGIGAVMVTGDNRAIAQEIARKLEIPGTDVVGREALSAQRLDDFTAETFRKTRAFAEILPEDKYKLVEAAKKFYIVAANGDGINDLPAIKGANVGFAVVNAVDALKSAADIVLLQSGIAVMRDAFIEGRKIFARLYSYSLYRISESFRLIITIAILGLLIGTYPLSPLQLILIALLNDIPIISLAFDRVKIAKQPSRINVKDQFITSLLFGLVGVANSLCLYFFALQYLHLPLAAVQTLFFLKLTVSGHLLIYVAHTKERWWRYLPSKEVILATCVTQAIATALAVSGFLMPSPVSWRFAVFIWLWSLFFMQISEAVKWMRGGAQN